MSQLNRLFERFARRDRMALARLITYLDDGGDPRPVFDALPIEPSHPTCTKVALTGSAGVGKSSLIGALVQHIRGSGKSVAVLMCDPSSARTGGALLGDRVRIEDDPADNELYIRSIATRGGVGGISESAGPIARLLERFGFEVVLIETIGVGQDQVAASDVADLLVLVLTPQSGDEMQWQKAGLMECADLIAINKADLGGADAVARSLHAVANVPVNPVSAETGEGVAHLWAAIEQSAAKQDRSSSSRSGEAGL